MELTIPVTSSPWRRDGPHAVCAPFIGGASAAPSDGAMTPVQVADFTSIERDSLSWTVRAAHLAQVGEPSKSRSQEGIAGSFCFRATISP